jgi:hypothetical protein
VFLDQRAALTVEERAAFVIDQFTAAAAAAKLDN